MPLYACLGRRRGIFGEICVGRSFRIFILLRMTWSTIRVERTLSLSCRDYNYSYIILYPPGMSPLEINSSESCGPVQHMHHVFPRTYFSATICFQKRYSVIPQLFELTFRPQSAFKNDIQ